MENKLPCRNEQNCIFRKIDEDMIIFSEEGQWLHQLNDIGADIWNLCDGTLNIEQIIGRICDEYDIDFKNALIDVSEFLKKMSDKNLIIYKEEILSKT
ncbi:MAG: PqqD family protein [Candidatus Kuenenia sp.]|nr:PqqD family protein [Candidatus Kuenenia hertensis]